MEMPLRTTPGKHCASSALKHMLDFHAPRWAAALSESFLLGLGGGCSAFCTDDDFFGTTWSLPRNVCAAVDGLAFEEIVGDDPGWATIDACLRSGRPVAILTRVGALRFGRFDGTWDFEGHTFLLAGRTGDGIAKYHIVDRDGCYADTQANLEAARSWGSHFLRVLPHYGWFVKTVPAGVDLPLATSRALRLGAQQMLAPAPLPHADIALGLNAIVKFALLFRRIDSNVDGRALIERVILTIDGGSGGGCFRAMFAQFLEEASAFCFVDPKWIALARDSASNFSAISKLCRAMRKATGDNFAMLKGEALQNLRRVLEAETALWHAIEKRYPMSKL